MNDQKISSGKQKKIEEVECLSKKLRKSKSVVFADYRGIAHKQLEELRKKLKNLDAEFSITKNTLIKKALEESGGKLDKKLSGPTATLFSYDDEIAPLKELVRFFKNEDKGLVKLGFLENRILSEDEVTRLASLPTKLELRTKVVGAISSPLSGLHNALSWNMKKLVWTIEEIRKQKSN